MAEPIYRDLTGGLCESADFQALYEIKGSGAFDYEVGDEISIIIASGREVKGVVCTINRSGSEWHVVLEPIKKEGK